MKIATRKQVTPRLESYRLLDGTRIGWSPDRRIVHLPWGAYCLFSPLLGWLRQKFKAPSGSATQGVPL